MEQIFYLIRHAETDWNVLRRLQGHTNIDINQNGKLQAEKLHHRIKKIKIDHVISSDLNRAIDTARIAFPLPYKIKTKFELREVHLGSFEGWTREQITASITEDFWQQWTSHKQEFLDMRFPSGESKREALMRILECLHEELDMFSGKSIAFFSHGLAMRLLIHYLRPDLQQTHFIENCGTLKMARDTNKTIHFLEYIDSQTDFS